MSINYMYVRVFIVRVLYVGGIQFEDSCCTQNCNSPNGRCVPQSDNNAFMCQCTSFYTGDACKALSNISIVVITLAGALFFLILIIGYNYRASLGKKSQVLEELRQGLLYDNNDTGTGNTLDNINEAYIQSLQQGLILKDVSVKYDEIDIEKQVGEGSFGVRDSELILKWLWLYLYTVGVLFHVEWCIRYLSSSSIICGVVY